MFEEHLKCPFCDNEYTHFLCTLEVKTKPNSNEATSIIIDGEFSVDVQFLYPYRSQKNIHLLFACEAGHYFIKSFDGHKGNVFTGRNDVMEDLEKWLNDDFKIWREEDPENNFISLKRDPRLLLTIQNYFYINYI